MSKYYTESAQIIEKEFMKIKPKDVDFYVEDRINDLKNSFFNYANSSNFIKSFFCVDNEILWDLFYNYYDVMTAQLTLNKHLILESTNVSFIPRTEKYLIELPNFTQIIIHPIGNNVGIKIEFDIPLRKLIVDFIVIYSHAFTLHFKLRFSENINRKLIERIDTYIRQLIVLSVTILEASFYDSNWFAIQICQNNVLKEKLIEIDKNGVYSKLQNLPKLWMQVLNNSLPIPAAIEDMQKIIEIRNRLVHLDNSECNWYASHLDFLSLSKIKSFSKRIENYMQVASYGFEGTYIGYEIQLANFCFDTITEVLIFFHSIFHRNMSVDWLEMEQKPDGHIDINKYMELNELIN